MKLIGTVAHVQIQQNPLKVGEGASRVYDPAPILRLNAIRLTHEGVLGLTDDGREIVDVHHRAHPKSRNNKNVNGISLGFTTSYNRMRGRFGTHIVDGIGGENIIIEPAPGFDVEDLHTDLSIETPDGWVRLRELMIAAPCNPFSRYCAGSKIDGEELKQTLQFLADGTRGFYATLCIKQPDQPVIRARDKVYAILEGEPLD